MVSAEITVKYKVRDIISEEDLHSYYGEGQPATIEEAIRDMLTVCSIQDLSLNEEESVVEIKEL